MYDNYYSDHRVRAAEKHNQNFDEQRMVLTMTLYDDENDEEFEAEFPAVFEVCPTCRGKGQHVNPSIDCNGLSAEDFAEDPDFAEDYFSGRYDVSCYGCNGKRVIPVINEEYADPDLLKILHKINKQNDEFRRIQEAERRMGC
jgi:hypothetical protein